MVAHTCCTTRSAGEDVSPGCAWRVLREPRDSGESILSAARSAYLSAVTVSAVGLGSTVEASAVRGGRCRAPRCTGRGPRAIPAEHHRPCGGRGLQEPVPPQVVVTMLQSHLRLPPRVGAVEQDHRHARTRRLGAPRRGQDRGWVGPVPRERALCGFGVGDPSVRKGGDGARTGDAPEFVRVCLAPVALLKKELGTRGAWVISETRRSCRQARRCLGPELRFLRECRKVDPIWPC